MSSWTKIFSSRMEGMQLFGCVTENDCNWITHPITKLNNGERTRHNFNKLIAVWHNRKTYKPLNTLNLSEIGTYLCWNKIFMIWSYYIRFSSTLYFIERLNFHDNFSKRIFSLETLSKNFYIIFKSLNLIEQQRRQLKTVFLLHKTSYKRLCFTKYISTLF